MRFFLVFHSFLSGFGLFGLDGQRVQKSEFLFVLVGLSVLQILLRPYRWSNVRKVKF